LWTARIEEYDSPLIAKGDKTVEVTAVTGRYRGLDIKVLIQEFIPVEHRGNGGITFKNFKNT
jgi:hypothetical protein